MLDRESYIKWSNKHKRPYPRCCVVGCSNEAQNVTGGDIATPRTSSKIREYMIVSPDKYDSKIYLCQKCNVEMSKLHRIRNHEEHISDVTVYDWYDDTTEVDTFDITRSVDEVLTLTSNIDYGIQYGDVNKKQSKGESLVEDVLKSLDVQYKKEHTFPDLRDKGLLRLDFYVPSKNLAIEYDGRQHFEDVPFYTTNCSFEDIQRRDSIKDTYCMTNGIKLIRIPYTIQDFYTIEKLLSPSVI